MSRQAPGPGTLEFITGVRKYGFLDYIGRCWRKHGDVFQVRLGSRTMIFAMHPDAMEHVNMSDKQNYDKRHGYDALRQYEPTRSVYAYHPFAIGQRICLGNKFSLLETHILLAMLAQRFISRLPASYKPRFEMHGMLGIVNGLPMTIAAR